jgi:hypothetical protein
MITNRADLTLDFTAQKALDRLENRANPKKF